VSACPGRKGDSFSGGSYRETGDKVFAWYIKNYGPEVNVFVDHSQIIHLESMRSGVWGSRSLWGRVVTYKG